MPQFFAQLIVFAIIGGVVYAVSRLLRCKASVAAGANPRRSTIHALIAVAVSMSIIDLLMLRQYRQHGPTPGSGPTFTQLTDLVPQIVVLAGYVVPAAIFMLRNREGLGSVGIGTRSLWQAVLIGLGLALLTFYFQPGGFWTKIGKVHAQHALAFVFYAFVGFGEEFLFRGYLQSRLVGWLGALPGWVLASVSMALVHYPHRWLIEGQSAGAAAVSSLALVPVSLLMGFVMLRTGNIVAPGLFHTFANWVNTLR